MTITMNTTHIPTIPEMQNFIRASHNTVCSAKNKIEAYDFVTRLLRTHRYPKQGRGNKGVIRDYLQKITGYGRAQVARLIAQFATKGRLALAQVVRPGFPVTYTDGDVLLLAETDKAHGVLSGPATLAIMWREWSLFKNGAYERLSGISVSHLYNLRGGLAYRQSLSHFTKTAVSKVTLGQRVKPRPEGRPGFIRVDSVHQGDRDGEKGVYHINLVDEVTQWEIAVCVEKISERFLVPALASALAEFPFAILNFHADNGSEYINRFVAGLLDKMHIRLTKSRPRHSGDNGLVECKNGAVIRKQLGYAHIPQINAERINHWMSRYLNPYLNFHRPCAFPLERVDLRGKLRKTYPQTAYRTPYEKLGSLGNPSQYLRRGLSFAELDKIAYSASDTEAAKELSKQKQILFSRLSFPSS